MASEGFASVETTVSAAEQATSQGRHDDAISEYRKLVAEAHVIDYEYEAWARQLAELYLKQDRWGEAGYLYLYLHDFENARQAFAGPEFAAERGHVLLRERRYLEAATAYEEAGCIVQAAVACEEAKDHARATGLWKRLSHRPRLVKSPYERALVHFNLGVATQRAAGEQAPGSDAAAHMAEAQRLLEEVADDFETHGKRERAFDCYHTLLQLGTEAGSFENIAEGYLNCIRVLKADGLKFYVLQFYEDFVRMALERGELHAAATLFREAAEYAMQMGLPYHRHYLRAAADAWHSAAERGLETGKPMDLVENALVAGIDCLAAVGDFHRVRETFRRLSELDLPERKQKRYAAIFERFAGARSEVAPAPEFPDYLRQPHAYARVWFIDLVEWELEGDPARVAGTIVGDRKYPAGFRRRALNLMLFLGDARATSVDGSLATLGKTARLLGELQSYSALAPLERLLQHPAADVRRQVMRALRYMPFKRSLGLVVDGLADADAEVREAAIASLRGLHFSHAFDPLQRIFREHPDDNVKIAALTSIGRIQTLEAGEFLIGVVRHEPDRFRKVAKKALESFDTSDIVPVLEEHAQLEANPSIRRQLQRLVGRLR